MRTLLFTGVAALGLTFGAGAFAQAPAPEVAPPAPPNTAAPAAPGQAPPEQVAPPAAADESAAVPAAPIPHHRVHHASVSGTGGEHWAHQPGTGQSGPPSTKASNITEADTRSAIAPHLPQPAVGEGANADSYLQAAQAALQSHRTGAAQQALEMAETRLLDRSTPVNAAGQPDQDAAVQQVANARTALAKGDTQGANSAIQMALGGATGQ
ncbi:MAG: hypothetical protein WDN04_15205 [Rhodospirillales bacterium]